MCIWWVTLCRVGLSVCAHVYGQVARAPLVSFSTHVWADEMDHGGRGGVPAPHHVLAYFERARTNALGVGPEKDDYTASVRHGQGTVVPLVLANVLMVCRVLASWSRWWRRRVSCLSWPRWRSTGEVPPQALNQNNTHIIHLRTHIRT